MSKLFDLVNSNRSIVTIIYELRHRYGLYVKEDERSGLIIIKYDRDKSKFNEPIVHECRGVVMNRSKKILCFPPERSVPLDKFKELTRDHTDEIRYEEHVDGTMINVFYDPNNETWLKSTRSRIGADCNWLCDETFATLFEEASGQMNFNVLNKDLCYTFVLVHPKNRIVVKYEIPFICLVSVRRIFQTHYENVSLEDEHLSLVEKGISIKVPKRYYFPSIERMEEYVSHQDSRTQGIIMKYDKYRAKLRNKEYTMLKNLKGNTPSLVELYLRLRQERKVKPFLKHFREYRKKFNEFRDDIHQITFRVYNWYVNVYINKYSESSEIPYEFKPVCYQLHKMYIDSVKNRRRRKITLERVISHVNILPIYSLIFIRKHYLNRVDNNLHM
ncbi:MAG: hypothetical protein CMB80_14575 [Flammeovirgaceae bacterium]|nr:hypothetical protein [Flammeovirgaceae bacterium]